MQNELAEVKEMFFFLTVESEDAVCYRLEGLFTMWERLLFFMVIF